MNHIVLYISKADGGRKAMSETGETFIIFLWVLAGSFARQTWPVIITAAATGEWIWGNAGIWLARLAAAAIVGVPSMWITWENLKNAEPRMRWAAAFTAGLLTDVV